MTDPKLISTNNVLDLLEQANELREAKPQDAVELFEQALAAAKLLQDKELWFESLLGLSNTKLLLGLYRESFDLAYQASKYKLNAELHHCFAKNYAELGDNAQALFHFLEALELLKDQAGSDLYVASLNNIAILHHMQGDHELELNALQEALKHLASSNQFGLALLRNNMAVSYVALGAFDLAFDNAQQAYEIAQQTNKQALVATILATLGEVFLASQNAKQAIVWLERALKLAAELGIKDVELLSLKFIGDAYKQLGNADNAVTYLEQALELAQQTAQKLELSKCHLSLAEVYKQAQDTGKALEHFEHYHKLNTELFNADADRNLKNLQVLHDTAAIKAQAEAEKERADDLELRVVERTRALERSHVDVLERLMMVARHHDGETAEHTKRVGVLASEVASALDCDEAFVRNLRLAARLHDLGKVGVPDRILLKPGKLTKEEFEVIKRHTTMGADMLAGKQSELMEIAHEIALSHHERWDGSGYPSGLVGQDIPLVGRIVAVVDTFDALIHERPYKDAWSKEEALAEIKAQSGKMFDPDVVHAFLSIV